MWPRAFTRRASAPRPARASTTWSRPFSRLSTPPPASAWTAVARDANGARPEYRFAPIARRLDEFEPMCHFHQTSPESHFTRKRVCSLATPDGRVTVSDMRLIVTRGAERSERDLADEAEVAATLRELFGVDLSAE